MNTIWLSDEQQRAWRAFLTVSALLPEVLGRSLDESSDLSLADYEIFVRLSESPGRALRMSDLAAQVVHSRSRLTHVVSRLEERGLVRRAPCADDRRGVLCVLTEDGMELLRETAPGHVRDVREHLFAHLEPEEVTVLERALSRVAAHLESAR